MSSLGILAQLEEEKRKNLESMDPGALAGAVEGPGEEEALKARFKLALRKRGLASLLNHAAKEADDDEMLKHFKFTGRGPTVPR